MITINKYTKNILDNLLKKISADLIIILILLLSRSASGLYNDDWTTAPTPNSIKLIKFIKVVIELTNPLTSDPKACNMILGNINPHITTIN